MISGQLMILSTASSATGFGRSREKNGKLVSPDTGNDVLGPECSQDNPGRQSDQIIPSFMPQGIIDCFQTVYIRHHDAHGKHSAVGKPFQLFIEKRPVIEAGQNIVSTIVTERYFHFLAAGNVMGDADDPDDHSCVIKDRRFDLLHVLDLPLPINNDSSK